MLRAEAKVLEIAGLSKHFDGVQAVTDVTFSVDRSAITSLIGPNGAGKSTVLKSVIGMLAARKGDILYHGARINGNKPSDNVPLGIAYSPQGNMVFDDLTVTENLSIGGYNWDIR
jgi:branched-chain amino acid transport system ATP-binding protein